jgi:hypothetical protein
MRAQSVAAKLELAAERRQLGPEAADVTRLARLTGLLSEGRDCPGGAGRGQRRSGDQADANDPDPAGDRVTGCAINYGGARIICLHACPPVSAESF